MDKIYDVLIIGAGASGLFLASNLRGLSFAILEKNGSAGKKIIASGGGRCNVTNRKISVENYHFTSVAGANLVQSALNELKFSDVLKFFGKLKFSEQKNAQFFCDSGSKDVLGALLSQIQKTRIFYGAEVVKTHKILPSSNLNGVNDEIFEIHTASGDKFYSHKLIIASGAPSYKALGASDIATKIAADFGVKFYPFAPALVGFTAQKDEFWFKNLSGVSVNARVSLDERNFAKTQSTTNINFAREFDGDVLFTHRGISGPAILNASLFWQKGAIKINFAPNFAGGKFKALNLDINTISPYLLQGKKQISSVLNLPRRFTLEFLRAKNLVDKPFDAYNAQERDKILQIFSYRFAPAGTFGFERAEVCKDGVSAEELDENFECRRIGGLFFIGEATEITGMLGGYNLHFAFASALKVARHLSLGAS